MEGGATGIESQAERTQEHAVDISAEIKKLIESTDGQAGVLIRVLQQVQGKIGYLPQDVLRTISAELKVPLSEVYGIVSFYSFFSMVPKGRHILQVCKGTSCYVKGAERLLDNLQKEHALEPGGITSDGKFSLEVVRCLGCCGLSPVMSIGENVYRKVKPAQLKEILASFK
ncbi:MAG: NAD(P)H-dependent oxidoreductase subunit E [Chloroflexi bacterium]|nr:NAD(P)H-dependent oxidoreductase subunit E [Chloroflexota bacterium]